MESAQYGVAWSDDYNLGFEQVDSQHRRLFELVNNLVKACMEKLDMILLQDTLDFLVKYTVQHFADEEAVQLEYNYPGYKEHKQMHEDFKVTVGQHVQQFNESGSSEELSNTMNKIVVRWLINHIQREDMKIGAHIRSLQKQ